MVVQPCGGRNLEERPAPLGWDGVRGVVGVGGVEETVDMSRSEGNGAAAAQEDSHPAVPWCSVKCSRAQACRCLFVRGALFLRFFLNG